MELTVRTGLERPEVAATEAPGHPLRILGLRAQAGAKRSKTVRRAARDRQFVATREQMIELHVVLPHLHGVLKTMGGRGRKKRGRRTKDDTSRFIYYLVHVALPNLPFGSAAER